MTFTSAQGGLFTLKKFISEYAVKVLSPPRHFHAISREFFEFPAPNTVFYQKRV